MSHNGSHLRQAEAVAQLKELLHQEERAEAAVTQHKGKKRPHQPVARAQKVARSAIKEAAARAAAIVEASRTARASRETSAVARKKAVDIACVAPRLKEELASLAKDGVFGSGPYVDLYDLLTRADDHALEDKHDITYNIRNDYRLSMKLKKLLIKDLDNPNINSDLRKFLSSCTFLQNTQGGNRKTKNKRSKNKKSKNKRSKNKKSKKTHKNNL